MAHWTDELTNIPESVRQRLKNIAKSTGENPQVVLIRYVSERLMYRLSISRYREDFVLKGAWLFYLWRMSRRSTRDVDLLASVNNAVENVEAIFAEVIEEEVPHDDGLAFDRDSFATQEIQLDGDYSGIRLRMTAMLGRSKVRAQVDIGFDEAVVEEPVEAVLPVLLDYEPPRMKVYSPEVVIAEKLEAIVKLGTITTRFKDFFDVYVLAREQNFAGATLVAQVSATFTHRGTEIPETLPPGLSDEFATDPESRAQWRAFLRRTESKDVPEEFREVVAAIREFVGPVFRSVRRNEGLGEWTPGVGWDSE